MTDKTELEVTQAVFDAGWKGIDPFQNPETWDFAERLTQAAIAAMPSLATRAADPTPVAWAYTNEFWPLGSFPPSWTRVVKVHDGWTETQLYAHPPAVPADALVEMVARAIGTHIMPGSPWEANLRAELAAYRGEA